MGFKHFSSRGFKVEYFGICEVPLNCFEARPHHFKFHCFLYPICIWFEIWRAPLLFIAIVLPLIFGNVVDTSIGWSHKSNNLGMKTAKFLVKCASLRCLSFLPSSLYVFDVRQQKVDHILVTYVDGRFRNFPMWRRFPGEVEVVVGLLRVMVFESIKLLFTRRLEQRQLGILPRLCYIPVPTTISLSEQREPLWKIFQTVKTVPIVKSVPKPKCIFKKAYWNQMPQRSFYLCRPENGWSLYLVHFLQILAYLKPSPYETVSTSVTEKPAMNWNSFEMTFLQHIPLDWTLTFKSRTTWFICCLELPVVQMHPACTSALSKA